MNQEEQYQQAAFALPLPSETPAAGESPRTNVERPTTQFHTAVPSNRQLPGDGWNEYRHELDTRARLGLPAIGPGEFRAMLRFMETGEVTPPDAPLGAGDVFRDAEADGTIFDRRRERLNGAIELLARGIEGIVTSDGYRAYLEAMGRFHTYSANNVALIRMQRPAATRVAGIKAWNGMGRFVTKGEKGITIIRPVTTTMPDDATGEPTRTLTGFTTATVFDISQTNGAPVPERPSVRDLSRSDTEHSLLLKTRLMGFLGRSGVRVVRDHENEQRGYWSPARREIGIRADLAGVTELKTLAHETAHFLASHRGQTDRRDAETVAESTAFVVLHHYGIDTGEYSFPYVAGWAADPAVLQRNLNEIQTIGNLLIQHIGDECPASDASAGEGGAR